MLLILSYRICLDAVQIGQDSAGPIKPCGYNLEFAMPDLTPGTFWGFFRIDSILGRGPSGVVYQALRTSDARRVSLKIFDENIDETTLRRFEDDTRRLIGLSHPNILRVESVAREGRRLYVVSELFDGRSLRLPGSRSLHELGQLLLQSARGLGAAWMRLVLHRNLKPENILVSAAGDVKLTDFGQFRESTPYWAPERNANQSPDLRGDLYSLGTIFRQLIPAEDPDLDLLLQQMTRVETFERVQMVEDVISRLESWGSRQSASSPKALPLPPLPPPPPAPSLPSFPSIPTPAAWERPDPELTAARTSMVQALEAITRRVSRLPLRVPSPSPPTPSPPVLASPFPEPNWDPLPSEEPAKPPELPAEPWPARVAPPSSPPSASTLRPSTIRRPWGLGRVLRVLFWVGLFVGPFALRMHFRDVRNRELEEVRRLQEAGRTTEAKRRLEERIRKEKSSSDEKELLKTIQRDEWASTLARIRKLDEQMKYADALDVCTAYLKQAGGSPVPEALELQKSLKAWISAMTQAEQQRRTGADKRAADLLAKFGESRSREVQVILARWCEEDWAQTKKALDVAATQNDPYTAIAEIDRFLKKAHQGGSHKKDAEARKLSFQADVDYGELVDHIEDQKARAPAGAVTALEAFLAKPHAGGTHRDGVLQQIDELKATAKATLFSGRVSVARLAASPKGKRIAFTSDGLKLLDLDSRAEPWSPPVKSLIRALSFGSEDRLVTGMSNKVQAWDLSAKKELRSWAPSNSYLVALAVQPDGKTVVGVLSDGTLFTWDSDSDDPANLKREAAPDTVTLALSMDGSRLALAGRDKTLRVRELSSGTEVKWQGPPVAVTALALSFDGKKLLAGGANGLLTVWNAETGQPGPAVTGHTGSVLCAAFSPDGTILATGGADAQIRLSRAEDGEMVKALSGHRGRISSIAFVPGGLVSSSSDGSVRIWTLK
jgi:serine/threonine protein kinase